MGARAPECATPVHAGHRGSGSCTTLPGAVPVPGRHWLRYLHDTFARLSIHQFAGPTSFAVVYDRRQTRRRPSCSWSSASWSSGPKRCTKCSTGQMSSRWRGVTACAARRCTPGSESTPTGASRPSSTSPPSRTAARTRCRRSSRLASSRCAGPTPTGDHARSSTGSVVRASTRCPAGARSTGRSSATASSSRGSAGGRRRTTSAGSDLARWSSGRWTSSAAST